MPPSVAHLDCGRPSTATHIKAMQITHPFHRTKLEAFPLSNDREHFSNTETFEYRASADNESMSPLLPKTKWGTNTDPHVRQLIACVNIEWFLDVSMETRQCTDKAIVIMLKIQL